MQGRRVYATDTFQPGDYGIIGDRWYAMTPDGRLGNLSAHNVTEHEDGTVTVSPSILVTGGDSPGSWHGFLERGIWREV